MKLVLLALALAYPGASAQNIEFKNPVGLAKPNGYSHVVVVHSGATVVISGQVGFNSKGEMANDFPTQVAQAFANLGVALSAAGAAPANLIKLNCFVVGLNQEKLRAFRAARDKFVNINHPPASTLVGVQGLFRDDVLIEIDAEAVVQSVK